MLSSEMPANHEIIHVLCVQNILTKFARGEKISAPVFRYN